MVMANMSGVGDPMQEPAVLKAFVREPPPEARVTAGLESPVLGGRPFGALFALLDFSLWRPLRVLCNTPKE
jgi:hypothetical protein